jgi:hypothetical protein
MGQRHEITSDHIYKDEERYYFQFAVANGERFDAQQLRVIANTAPKERRGYLEKIISLLKRLDRTSAKPKTQ